MHDFSLPKMTDHERKDYAQHKGYPWSKAWIACIHLFKFHNMTRRLQSPNSTQPTYLTIDRREVLVNGYVFVQGYLSADPKRY